MKEFQSALVQEDELRTGASFHEETSRGHGREETRRWWTTTDPRWVPQGTGWEKFKSVALVESQRTVGDRTTLEHRFYISSLAEADGTRVAAAVRSHWQIENEVHWVLDVAFREDDCRIRVGNAAENFAVMRHLSLNLLKAAKSVRVGLANRRLRAGWDTQYLLRILTGCG